MATAANPRTKAAQVIMEGMHAGMHVYGVTSQRAGGGLHRVDVSPDGRTVVCDCPAWRYRHTCAHVAAVQAHLRERWEQARREQAAYAAADALEHALYRTGGPADQLAMIHGDLHRAATR